MLYVSTILHVVRLMTENEVPGKGRIIGLNKLGQMTCWIWEGNYPKHTLDPLML